jgi:group I intron endonuclease
MKQKCQADKISGIYKIINKINGKYYVGRSDNILGTSGRWKEHINRLNSNKHDNSYLQNAWNKYGSDKFDFVIVEKIDDSQKLLETEQKHLDAIKNDRRNLCYNLSFSANGGGFIGHKHLEESKKKTSEKLKGRPSPNKGPNLKLKGDKNPKYDHMVYVFKNIKTNKSFVGSRYDFCKKFNLERTGINKLATGLRKSSNNWIISY